MIRINLLPYREVRRRARLIRDATVAGAGVVAFLLVLGGWYWLLQVEARQQQQRVDYMQRQLAQLNRKASEVDRIKDLRGGLVAKIEVIRKLQRGRDRPVRLLQTLGRAVPKGVSLSRIQQEPEQLKLEGGARSNAAISSFMRRLEAAELFTDPALEVIRSRSGGDGPGKEFRLQVSLAVEGGEGADDGDGES